jgi:hypothetical protein
MSIPSKKNPIALPEALRRIFERLYPEYAKTEKARSRKPGNRGRQNGHMGWYLLEMLEPEVLNQFPHEALTRLTERK